MPEPRALLVIQSALHGEIRIALERTSTIGRSIASDIVVADHSLSSLHFRLDIAEAAAVRLEALEGDLVLEGGERLPPGAGCALLRTTRFHAGKVPFEFNLPDIEEETAPVSRSRRKMPAMVVVALLGSSAFATTEGSAISAHALSLTMETAVPALVEVKHQASEPLSHSRALAELRRLALDTVVLDTLDDGAFRATGTIADDERPQWAAFKKWLDAQSGGSSVLVDAVADDGKAPALAVQSAWLGDAPYVIDGQGEKLFAGASIGNGWKIESIEPGRVNVIRARQHAAVRF